MKKENIEYCIYCGTPNKLEDKKCIKCHKKLNPKDRPLLNYIKSKITDNVEGTIEDKIFPIIKEYIKSHLYGFILTCSVIATATCVIVNAVNDSYIEKVTEKPVFEEITYTGQGLTHLEVAETYVKAIIDGNTKTIKSLQLENFYPEIIKYLEEYTLNNPDAYPLPALEHNLVDNREILLKSIVIDPYVRIDEYAVSPEGYFGEYKYIGYSVSMVYCSYNTCTYEDDGGIKNEVRTRESLFLIEINGNYYVLGETKGVLFGVDEAVYRKALFNANGDTTNLSFEEELQKFDNCSQDAACLQELGYTDLYIN